MTILYLMFNLKNARTFKKKIFLSKPRTNAALALILKQRTLPRKVCNVLRSSAMI